MVDYTDSLFHLNPATIQPYSSFIFLGKRRSGKSTIILDLMQYHHHQIKPYHLGYIFSKTEFVTEKPTFLPFVPTSHVFTEMNKTTFQTLDKTFSKSAQSNFVVIDDQMGNAQEWGNWPCVQNLFFNGRHKQISIYLATQALMKVKDSIRANVDYVFVFKTTSIVEQKKIYQAYGSMFGKFQDFSDTLNGITRLPHTCMVLSLNSNGGLSDQVFKYKAQLHDEGRLMHIKYYKQDKQFCKTLCQKRQIKQNPSIP